MYTIIYRDNNYDGYLKTEIVSVKDRELRLEQIRKIWGNAVAVLTCEVEAVGVVKMAKKYGI